MNAVIAFVTLMTVYLVIWLLSWVLFPSSKPDKYME